MRISDWSSDVCSSDLIRICPPLELRSSSRSIFRPFWRREGKSCTACGRRSLASAIMPSYDSDGEFAFDGIRSEEHTSELQSLMRISYAVFCLKKKKIENTLHVSSTMYRYNKHKY